MSRNINVGQTSLYGLYLPSHIKSDFSKAKTAKEMRQNLCRGARAVAKQLAMMRSGIRIVKPITELVKLGLGNAGMPAQAAQVAEAVVVTEEAVVAVDSVVLSAEALVLTETTLVTAEVTTAVEVVIAGGLSVGAGIALGTGAGVVILVIAYCWFLGRNHVAADKRSLLDDQFRKLIQEVRRGLK